jgi:uncharacterized LabA/DUF88 family protein
LSLAPRLQNRTAFLVDGFNVYHSLKDAEAELQGRSTRWLDLRSLFSSYLYIIGAGATLGPVYYFSALATHLEKRKPGVTARHRSYIECLRLTQVIPVLGRFKFKSIRCHVCHTENPHFEEKETDVALAAKLFELLHRREAETVVLVSGDTDLAPAIRAARSLFRDSRICIAFPYRRKNAELAVLADKYFHIRHRQYAVHQFPDLVKLPGGRQVKKPIGW